MWNSEIPLNLHSGPNVSGLENLVDASSPQLVASNLMTRHLHYIHVVCVQHTEKSNLHFPEKEFLCHCL